MTILGDLNPLPTEITLLRKYFAIPFLTVVAVLTVEDMFSEVSVFDKLDNYFFSRHSTDNTSDKSSYRATELQYNYSTMDFIDDMNKDGIFDVSGIAKDGSLDTLLSLYKDDVLMYRKK